MKALFSLSATSAILAVALSGLASPARASEVKIHLPVAARWGSQILPAGDYRFDFSQTAPLAYVSGKGVEATVFVTSSKPQSPREHSFLRMVDVQGTPTVVAFGSSAQGVIYQFAVPKSHPLPHAPAAELAQRR